MNNIIKNIPLKNIGASAVFAGIFAKCCMVLVGSTDVLYLYLLIGIMFKKQHDYYHHSIIALVASAVIAFDMMYNFAPTDLSPILIILGVVVLDGIFLTLIKKYI